MAMRLLSKGPDQEEETKDATIEDLGIAASEDAEDEDDDSLLYRHHRKMPASLISGLNNTNGADPIQLKKGILWQQRDKIFSRHVAHVQLTQLTCQ